MNKKYLNSNLSWGSYSNLAGFNDISDNGEYVKIKFVCEDNSSIHL
jgi:hypothetical protein